MTHRQLTIQECKVGMPVSWFAWLDEKREQRLQGKIEKIGERLITVRPDDGTNSQTAYPFFFQIEAHPMNKPPTPFETFEQLAKTVVRVPKKEVVKLEQKRKAKQKTKKKKPRK